MVDLVASDVTVTVEEKRRAFKERRHIVKIEFGDGSLTYPSGGVPLPGFADFGMVRNLSFLNLFDPDDSKGLVYKFDYENSKLRIYEQAATPDTGDADGELGELDAASDAPAAQTLYAEAVGW